MKLTKDLMNAFILITNRESSCYLQNAKIVMVVTEYYDEYIESNITDATDDIIKVIAEVSFACPEISVESTSTYDYYGHDSGIESTTYVNPNKISKYITTVELEAGDFIVLGK